MGSVKDLTVLRAAGSDGHGVGRFHFSDRYSVFDWGEMPDQIAGKGQALCIIGAYFFEKLEAMGLNTHYLGVVEDGVAKKLADARGPVDTMEVKLVQVLKPFVHGDNYDYSMYSTKLSNNLIPLEVIYRNTLPAGSSVFRRLKDGSLQLSEIGLSQMPAENTVLDTPILDASTKLEVTDRYLSWAEAQTISALTDSEIQDLKDAVTMINNVITETVEKIGLTNEDGKVEFAFNELRKLMLVDVLATPDECRFNYKGLPVSKEVARIYYRKTDWYPAIEAAKKKDRAHWKEICAVKPQPLPGKVATLIAQMYQAFCNEVTGRKWFGVPALVTVLDELHRELA
jgi:phosphoribosylaminoimidazole-succinocarboxamide synthase